MKMDGETKDMWMSKEMNNNINIILIDSLESLHQREFGLQSSQQRVVFSLSLSWETYKNRGGMKEKKNGLKRIGQSSGNGFSLHWLLVFLCFTSFASCWFLRGQGNKMCFLSFYKPHQPIGQSELFCVLSTSLALSTHVQLNQEATC